jgi:hypothetical protein
MTKARRMARLRDVRASIANLNAENCPEHSKYHKVARVAVRQPAQTDGGTTDWMANFTLVSSGASLGGQPTPEFDTFRTSRAGLAMHAHDVETEVMEDHGHFHSYLLSGRLIVATGIDQFGLIQFPLGQKMLSRRCDGICRRATSCSRDRDSVFENRLMCSVTTRLECTSDYQTTRVMGVPDGERND